MTQNDIDRIPDDVLIYVLRHPDDMKWNFLAMKIILTRLTMKMKVHRREPSTVVECCHELRILLMKSVNVPSARADITQILSLAGVEPSK